MSAINNLLLGARAEALLKQSEARTAWRDLSIRLGTLLPNSLLLVTIQKDGEIDLILRCIEDDIAALQPHKNPKSWDDFDIDFLNTLARYWIGSEYETFRILKNLITREDDPIIHEIHRELALIRMPLEKHQIAADVKLPGKIKLQRHPPNDIRRDDDFVYDPKDPRRSHIMPQGVCEFCGSIMWDAVDGAGFKPVRIARRGISDKILALAKRPILKQHKVVF